MLRQGDVLLIPTTKKAKVGKKIEREGGRVVLAHGEVTGHCHAIADEGVDLYETETAGERMLVVEADGAVLEHDEHGAIVIEPGRYLVRTQREYTPQAIVNVRD